MNIYHKVCPKCEISKPITEYHKKKSNKDGHHYYCKICLNLINKICTEKTKNTIIVFRKKCVKCCITKNILDFNKSDGNKDGHRYDCRQCQKVSRKIYKTQNMDKVRESRKRYESNRIKTDPLYKLRLNVSCLIRNTIRNNGYNKSLRTQDILGCSYEEFKTHIEKQFVEGMSWDNRFKWQLDHITPVSWGKTEEEIVALNYYTNFQPLWTEDNNKKSNKFSG